MTGHTILGDEVCVNDDAGEPVCVTGTQLRSLLNGAGSVLGSHTEDGEAADAPSAGWAQGAPDGPSSSSGLDADTASSTPPAADEEADPIEADPAAQEEPSPEMIEAAEPPPAPELEAANDNSSIVPLAPTGTE